MNTLNDYINNCLFCRYQKCLDSKALKAYRIDLTQFVIIVLEVDIANIIIQFSFPLLDIVSNSKKRAATNLSTYRIFKVVEGLSS